MYSGSVQIHKIIFWRHHLISFVAQLLIFLRLLSVCLFLFFVLPGNSSTFLFQLADLILPSRHLLTVPTQLPRIQLASLYLHGPYKVVLESGIRILVGIHRLLVEGHGELEFD